MRILFIGCVESSLAQLQLLLDSGKDIVGVVTRKKSDFNADFCDISILCRDKEIPFIYSQNINDDETRAFIESCHPDIGYCFGWSQLIRHEVLRIPSMGIIGNHPAELPHNRGRHPIIWALVLGLSQTASTFFRMDEGADTGDIISQEIIPIEYTDYARDLYDKITKSECSQILRFTEELENGALVPIKQKSKEGNSWRKRSVTDGMIDWRMSTRAIYNLVRGLSSPYPGATFEYNSDMIRIWRCEEIDAYGYKNIEPGKIIKVNNCKDYIIKAYDGLIHVLDGDEFNGKEGDYL